MRPIVTVLVVGFSVTVLWGGRLTAQGNPEAAKIQNPVMRTPESIAAGKATYRRFCASCHGIDGEGSPGNDLTPPAPALTGKVWKHGSTDGEIFETIKDGVQPELNMPAWGAQGVNDTDIWNIVNYIRTLEKK